MAGLESDFERSKVREPPSRQDAKAFELTAAEDFVARQIVDAAVAVHTTLGPGLLESVYEQCLTCKLGARGLSVERQVAVPVTYRQIRIDRGEQVTDCGNS
jgi:hypothetical protein